MNPKPANLCDFHCWLKREYGNQYNSLFGIGTEAWTHESVVASKLLNAYDRYLREMGFEDPEHTKRRKEKR